MIKQITKNIIQFSFREFGSHAYLLKKESILIDTGSPKNRDELLSDLKDLKLNPDDIKIVLLTHLHWDHMGNVNLFKKAKIYASAAEIEDFRKSKEPFLLEEFIDIKPKLLSLPAKIKGLEVIETPGHTRGSVAFYLPKQKILFSGDTIFDERAYAIGRIDLPTSAPDQMMKSIKKLLELDFKILCPGH